MSEKEKKIEEEKEKEKLAEVIDALTEYKANCYRISFTPPKERWR